MLGKDGERVGGEGGGKKGTGGGGERKRAVITSGCFWGPIPGSDPTAPRENAMGKR